MIGDLCRLTDPSARLRTVLRRAFCRSPCRSLNHRRVPERGNLNEPRASGERHAPASQRSSPTTESRSHGGEAGRRRQPQRQRQLGGGPGGIDEVDRERKPGRLPEGEVSLPGPKRLARGNHYARADPDGRFAKARPIRGGAASVASLHHSRLVLAPYAGDGRRQRLAANDRRIHPRLRFDRRRRTARLSASSLHRVAAGMICPEYKALQAGPASSETTARRSHLTNPPGNHHASAGPRTHLVHSPLCNIRPFARPRLPPSLASLPRSVHACSGAEFGLVALAPKEPRREASPRPCTIHSLARRPSITCCSAALSTARSRLHRWTRSLRRSRACLTFTLVDDFLHITFAL